MFDRRLVQNFDWVLLIITILIATVGIINLYSAVAGDPASSHLYVKQLYWFGIGAVFMTAAFIVDYRLLQQWAVPIYAVSIILLIVVLFFGKVVSGSQRWLTLGPISFQPSELAKIACIIVLARHFSKDITYEGMSLRDLFKPFLWVIVPFCLITMEPDLGSGLLVLLVAGSIILFVKIQRGSFIFLAALGAAVMPLVWFFLKGYQKQRILTFLNPDRDPMGAGYHIIQSKIAIGSGMLSGKGFLKGTQSYLSFLPEQHTDFIFSVLAEEWGFLGAVTVITLFLVLLVWGINIALRSRENFGTIVAVGIVSMIGWQVVINVGMTMGLMPVVGVPLPLVSYGGSSVLTVMIGIGLLMNISMRRFMFQKFGR
ncbi:MAG: rod shape-determining protein RodA [Pseudomonadota bacterium]